MGPQSDMARRRVEVMIRTVSASAENQEEVAEAVDRFKSEASMLSYAAIGALTSLCVSNFFFWFALWGQFAERFVLR